MEGVYNLVILPTSYVNGPSLECVGSVGGGEVGRRVDVVAPAAHHGVQLQRVLVSVPRHEAFEAFAVLWPLTLKHLRLLKPLQSCSL